MKNKINNKGFTLIELLATIIILSILSTVTIVTVTKYYEKSKEKAIVAFEKQLKNAVDDYLSLNGTSLTFNLFDDNQKCYTNNVNNTEVCDSVKIYINNVNTPSFESIIKESVSKDMINPSTEISCTDYNPILKIYRDSDFVYCFKIEPDPSSTSNCIDNKINTCTMYKNAF